MYVLEENHIVIHETEYLNHVFKLKTVIFFQLIKIFIQISLFFFYFYWDKLKKNILSLQNSLTNFVALN